MVVTLPTNALNYEEIRGIAQPGSAPALGAGCREFESLYPDHFKVSLSLVLM